MWRPITIFIPSLLIVILSWPGLLRCATLPSSTDWIWLLADQLDPESFENEADFVAYLEEMAARFPVDLNHSSREELLIIPDISEHIVKAILDYRENREFRSTEELLEVPGIGPATFDALKPWVTTNYRLSGPRMLVSDLGVRQYFRYQQSFPAPEGYRAQGSSPAHYTGHPARLYHRQTITGSRFSANLTQVKLPGEPMSGPALFDFSSAHIMLEQTGPVQRLVIGDYALRYGQGLTLWSAASFGKGGTPHTAPFRRQHGITPYRSSGQIRFFRGAASEIAIPLPDYLNDRDSRLLLSGFYSNRAKSSVEIDADTIRPPTSSPYHRTENERERRFNTRELVRGGNIRVEYSRFRVGATYYDYRLNRPVIPYPQSSPLRGSDNRVWGSDLQLRLDPIRIFGEYAARMPDQTDSAPNRSGGSAWIAGIMGSLHDQFDWIFSLRNYDPGFWSELAGGFGEGSGPPGNQYGWYTGIRIRPFSGLRVAGFLDRFRFPEPVRSATRPVHGWESMLNINYRIRRDLDLLIRLRNKKRSVEEETRDSYSRILKTSGSEFRFTGRIRINWEVSDFLVIRTQYDRVFTGVHSHPETAAATGSHTSYRPEGHMDRTGISANSPVNQTKSTGMAFGQTFRLQLPGSLRLDMNWSVFDTADFNSRLYLYEYGLTNTMSSRMVYGQGRLSYVVMRFRPVSWLLMEAKYALIRYYDRPAIGTGHDRTTVPVRTHAGLQVQLSY